MIKYIMIYHDEIQQTMPQHTYFKEAQKCLHKINTPYVLNLFTSNTNIFIFQSQLILPLNN